MDLIATTGIETHTITIDNINYKLHCLSITDIAGVQLALSNIAAKIPATPKPTVSDTINYLVFAPEGMAVTIHTAANKCQPMEFELAQKLQWTDGMIDLCAKLVGVELKKNLTPPLPEKPKTEIG